MGKKKQSQKRIAMIVFMNQETHERDEYILNKNGTHVRKMPKSKKIETVAMKKIKEKKNKALAANISSSIPKAIIDIKHDEPVLPPKCVKILDLDEECISVNFDREIQIPNNLDEVEPFAFIANTTYYDSYFDPEYSINEAKCFMSDDPNDFHLLEETQ